MEHTLTPFPKSQEDCDARRVESPQRLSHMRVIRKRSARLKRPRRGYPQGNALSEKSNYPTEAKARIEWGRPPVQVLSVGEMNKWPHYSGSRLSTKFLVSDE